MKNDHEEQTVPSNMLLAERTSFNGPLLRKRGGDRVAKPPSRAEDSGVVAQTLQNGDRADEKRLPRSGI